MWWSTLIRAAGPVENADVCVAIPAILNEGNCSTKPNQPRKHQPMPKCLPKLVRAEVIAEVTGRSVKLIYRLAQQGRIPHYRISGTIRFDPQQIAEWLEFHRIAA